MKPPVTDSPGLEEWHRLHEDVKKHVSARQGEDLEKTEARAASWRRSNQERTDYICLTIRERPFFSQQKSKAEHRFSMGLSVG